MNRDILQPMVVLAAWTLVMLVWTMVVRFPAMKKAGIDLSKARGGRPGVLDGVIEDKAQWPAHNYIHLVEQPTLFYAVALGAGRDRRRDQPDDGLGLCRAANSSTA